MAGPCYFGFIVEKWTAGSVEAVKRKVASVLDEREGATLTVFAHQGSAWLVVHDPSEPGGKPAPGEHNLWAVAIASAAGSPTWVYEYVDASSFWIRAQRFLPDGKEDLLVEEGEDTEVPDETESATRYIEDLASKPIRRFIKWGAPLMRTGGETYDGPHIVAVATGQDFPLHGVEVDTTLMADEPEPPPPPETQEQREGRELVEAYDRVRKEARAVFALLEEAEGYIEMGESVRARGMERAFEILQQAMETLAQKLAQQPLDAMRTGLPPALRQMVDAWESGKAKASSPDEILTFIRGGVRAIDRKQLGAMEKQVLDAADGKMTAEMRVKVASTYVVKSVMVRLAWLALKSAA